MGQLQRNLGDQQRCFHTKIPKAQPTGLLFRCRYRTVSIHLHALSLITIVRICECSDILSIVGYMNAFLHPSLTKLNVLNEFSCYNRYTEVANNVQTQETILNIQFVLLDCSPLKFAILGHCQEWQNKFTSLLYKIATAKLKDLHVFLKTSAER